MTQTAKRLDLRTGAISFPVQAPEHRVYMQETKASADDFHFFLPDGTPVLYAQGEKNTAYFQRWRGLGQQSGIRGRLRADAERAFAGGLKHLIILDETFNYKKRELEFAREKKFRRLAPEFGLWTFPKWVLGNKGNFIATVPHSLDEAVDHLHKIKFSLAAAGMRMTEGCYVYSNGVVADYRHSFYDWSPDVREPDERSSSWDIDDYNRAQWHRQKLAELYRDLKETKLAITVRRDKDARGTDLDRAVGTPKIVRIHANPKTIHQDSAKGIKCNLYEDGKQSNLIVTLTTDPPALRQSPAFKKKLDYLLAGNDLYVLTTPTVQFDQTRQETERHTKGNLDWHVLNLVVSDPDKQLREVHEPPSPLASVA